ncbi:MAG: gliding motility-associated C-terminal domain-containing protein, partial [Alteromonas sp.]|nr:gliding motility-associated C-terminal domain-containing protein [Alteromonas sp.]
NWFPRALDVLDYSFTMNIYSKNGKLVYTTKHKTPWDGQDQNSGETCQEGFYIWHVLLTNENGEKEEYQGHIYLARP